MLNILSKFAGALCAILLLCLCGLRANATIDLNMTQEEVDEIYRNSLDWYSNVTEADAPDMVVATHIVKRYGDGLYHNIDNVKAQEVLLYNVKRVQDSIWRFSDVPYKGYHLDLKQKKSSGEGLMGYEDLVLEGSGTGLYIYKDDGSGEKLWIQNNSHGWEASNDMYLPMSPGSIQDILDVDKPWNNRRLDRIIFSDYRDRCGAFLVACGNPAEGYQLGSSPEDAWMEMYTELYHTHGWHTELLSGDRSEELTSNFPIGAFVFWERYYDYEATFMFHYPNNWEFNDMSDSSPYERRGFPVDHWVNDKGSITYSPHNYAPLKKDFLITEPLWKDTIEVTYNAQTQTNDTVRVGPFPWKNWDKSKMVLELKGTGNPSEWTQDSLPGSIPATLELYTLAYHDYTRADGGFNWDQHNDGRLLVGLGRIRATEPWYTKIFENDDYCEYWEKHIWNNGSLIGTVYAKDTLTAEVTSVPGMDAHWGSNSQHGLYPPSWRQVGEVVEEPEVMVSDGRLPMELIAEGNMDVCSNDPEGIYLFGYYYLRGSGSAGNWLPEFARDFELYLKFEAPEGYDDDFDALRSNENGLEGAFNITSSEFTDFTRMDGWNEAGEETQAEILNMCANNAADHIKGVWSEGDGGAYMIAFSKYIPGSKLKEWGVEPSTAVGARSVMPAISRNSRLGLYVKINLYNHDSEGNPAPEVAPLFAGYMSIPPEEQTSSLRTVDMEEGADGANTEYYNLQGQRVSNPRSGELYIVRHGMEQARKAIVR